MPVDPHPQTRRSPVRLHLIGGFLGSGKTTLLRRLLAEGLYGEKVVVLVNELGEVGIDGALLRKSGREVVELPSGCVCCQIGPDMLASVFEMMATFAPERIVIELTGVAEPGRVLGTLASSSELMARARVEPTICVVDCQAFANLTREMEYFFYCQVQAADIILLNKVDGVAPEEVGRIESALRACSPNAFLFPTHYCEIDLASVFERTSGEPAPAPGGHRHAAGEACGAPSQKPLFESFVWHDPQLVLDRGRIEAWSETLPPNLLRLKGTVRLAEGSFFLNWVRGSLHWEPAGPDDPIASTLVFIGQALLRAPLEEGLQTCRKRGARGLRLGGRPSSPP